MTFTWLFKKERKKQVRAAGGTNRSKCLLDTCYDDLEIPIAQAHDHERVNLYLYLLQNRKKRRGSRDRLKAGNANVQVLEERGRSRVPQTAR